MTTFFAGDLLPAADLNLAVNVETGHNELNADSATFSNTAESGSILTVTANLVLGQVYEVMFTGAVSSATVGNAVLARIREDNATGNQLALGLAHVGNTTSIGYQVALRAEYTAVATAAKTFALTGITYIGTGNSQFRAGVGRIGLFTVRLQSRP